MQETFKSDIFKDIFHGCVRWYGSFYYRCEVWSAKTTFEDKVYITYCLKRLLKDMKVAFIILIVISQAYINYLDYFGVGFSISLNFI